MSTLNQKSAPSRRPFSAIRFPGGELPCEARTNEQPRKGCVASLTMEVSGLEGEVARHFNNLSARGKIIAEYIWVGGSGGDLRSKSRVLSSKPRSVEELPVSHFDGRFTEQVQLSLNMYLAEVLPSNLRAMSFVFGLQVLSSALSTSPVSFAQDHTCMFI